LRLRRTDFLNSIGDSLNTICRFSKHDRRRREQRQRQHVKRANQSAGKLAAPKGCEHPQKAQENHSPHHFVRGKSRHGQHDRSHGDHHLNRHPVVRRRSPQHRCRQCRHREQRYEFSQSARLWPDRPYPDRSYPVRPYSLRPYPAVVCSDFSGSARESKECASRSLNREGANSSEVSSRLSVLSISCLPPIRRSISKRRESRQPRKVRTFSS
jgi:hypothetical protein